MKDGDTHPSGGEPPDPTDPASAPDPSDLAHGFSAILSELAHTPEAELGRWAPPPREGERLGRFLLRRQLGRGGMGVVWEAEDTALARRVALKLVRTGTQATHRGDDWLKREAEAVARLNHPNIVTLHDHGTSEAGPYLVFERLYGRTLGRALVDGPLAFPAVLEIALAVAGALDHAHRAGVVHRDLKPSNVFLLDGGGLKVLDFGLASLLGQSGLGDAGSPAFMAPEQWRGELGDARTDLFALGVTLWNALTGRLPFAVKDARSAVADPGPTPRLPVDAAPPAFRRLVEQCLERDPAARPPSAQAVLEALRGVARDREARPRHRLVAALAVAALAGFGAAGWLWWTGEPAPGDRLITVVAEPVNRSGDPGLDDLSRLLTTSLEQSGRLTLLSRPRLASMAREAKLEQPERLDGPRARDLGRLGHARVLLLPEARKEGTFAVLTVRAVDPEDERLLFERSATVAGPAEVPGAVDQLSEALRAKLHERREDLASGRIQLASAISPNLDAARAYYQGIDCWWHGSAQSVSSAATCPPFFKAALASDPSFAMAHFWLARTSFLRGGGEAVARPHIAAALAALDRLPARERLLVRSFAAHVEGREPEAIALVDEALARFPDDTETLDQAATLRIQRYDYAGAIPYLERLVALEPEDGDSQHSLVEALQALDRREALQALVGRLEARSASPAVDRALVRAYVGLGRPEAAVARARARLEQVGPEQGRRLLWNALSQTGQAAAQEPFERAAAASAPDDPIAAMGLAGALVGQGRLREALRVLDGSESRSGTTEPGLHAFAKAILLAGEGDVAALGREADRAFQVAPDEFAFLAVPLALRGEMSRAERLAARLPTGPVREAFEALRSWRAGDAADAAARLERQLALGLDPPDGIHPGYLLAEVSLAAGEPATALSGLDRFRRGWAQGRWTCWAWPRSRLLAAKAHLALGHRDEARGELDRLLAELKRADPDLPLLREARTLRAALDRR